MSCTSTDEIDVTFNAQPVVNLGYDNYRCEGYPLTLNSGYSTGVLWSTGETTQTIDVTTTGTYSVVVDNGNGCTASDEIYVQFEAAPANDLGPDITACDGETVTLDAGTSYKVLWSTGETTQTIDVTTSGTYWVELGSSMSCTSTDEVVVTFDNCVSSCTNPDYPNGYTVTGSEVWNSGSDIYIDGELRVSSGSLYILNSTIHFGPCGKLVVDRGAYLNINNSTLTGCDRWYGIEVWGDASSSTRSISVQGALQIDGKTTIEKADIGILVGKRNGSSLDQTYAGGILLVNGVMDNYFTNNGTHMLFLAYNYDMLNTITNCYFSPLALSGSVIYCDANITNNEAYIRLLGNGGVTFTNNVFEGDPSMVDTKENIAIWSTASSIDIVYNVFFEHFIVAMYDENSSHFSAGKNTVTNSYNGITYANTSTHGIYLYNTSNIMINDNDFSTPGHNDVLLNGCTDFSLPSNLFNADYGLWTQFCNSGSGSTMQDNVFENCRYSWTSIDDDFSTLTFNCNNFKNYSDYGIHTQGTTILKDQGNASIGASNKFTSSSILADHQLLYNGTGITYYCGNSSYCSDMGSNVSVVSATSSEACLASMAKTGTTTAISDETILEDNTSIEVSIYPNPATDEVYIEFKGQVQNINLMDIQGRTLRSLNVQQLNGIEQINVSDLANGIYIIELISKEGMVSHHKVLKQ